MKRNWRPRERAPVVNAGVTSDYPHVQWWPNRPHVHALGLFLAERAPSAMVFIMRFTSLVPCG